jgi:hypothetical protein
MDIDLTDDGRQPPSCVRPIPTRFASDHIYIDPDHHAAASFSQAIDS